jgi:hypothetical protein
MNTTKKILTILILLLSFKFNYAQNLQSNKEVSNPVKLKQPKLYTSLGIFSDSVNLPVDQAKAVISAPLKVVDDKGNVLTVTYYQFLYVRNAFVEDEQTGKVRKTTSNAADYFTATPLPEKWTKIIKEQLTTGEQLYFFDVIAKDQKGHAFYAPNLKINIK